MEEVAAMRAPRIVIDFFGCYPTTALPVIRVRAGGQRVFRSGKFRLATAAAAPIIDLCLVLAKEKHAPYLRNGLMHLRSTKTKPIMSPI